MTQPAIKPSVIESWMNIASQVPEYEAILPTIPDLRAFLSDDVSANNLHENLAKNSFIQQAWRGGAQKGQSYFVDVGPYLDHGGEVVVNMDSARSLSEFKGSLVGKGSKVWQRQVAMNFAAYKDTLLAGHDSVATVDLSPLSIALWVLDDVFEIQRLIPTTVESVLDICCGVGAANIFINQIGQRAKTFSLIDTDEESLKSAHQLLRDNGLNIKSPDLIDTFDLIISLRSCCFLYGFDEYEAIFRNQTREGSVIIVDVGHDRVEETLAFFGELCSSARVLTQDDANNHRYIFVR